MGGTFNPVHLGHLRAAEEMAERFALNEVVFVPAAHPPHKGRDELASFEDRLAMLRLAVGDRPLFTVSDVESRLPGPSYTVNTLKAASAELGSDGELFFLVGYDSFRTVAQWRDHLELFRLASFMVFRRPGLRGGRAAMGRLLEDALARPSRWASESESFFVDGFKPIHYYQGCRLEISSTDLRRRLTEGLSVRYLVPDLVVDFIAGRGLYVRRRTFQEKRSDS
jgi:nicotinate-nucleotide adenylyltransferase